MLPKILLVLFGLAAFNSDVEAQTWIKRVHLLGSEVTEETPGYHAVHLQLVWEYSRADFLQMSVKGVLATDANVTLVGWQQILNDDGSVKEVDTVQLVIPPVPEDFWEHSDLKNSDKDDGYEADEDPVTEIRKFIKASEVLGLQLGAVTVEKFSRDGEEEALRYADARQEYSRVDGFTTYNKTAIVSLKDLEKVVKSFNSTILGAPTLLRYDGNGKLLVDQSTIQPYLLGTVIDQYEAPESVILAGPEIIAKISQQYPREQIAKQLGAEFNKVFSDYRWRVLVNSQHHYVTRDVDITLTYDQFDLGGGTDDEFYIYGIKRSNVT